MKLVSWNVQWGRDASGHVDLARTVREARRLADFDVLCLQEITRGFGALPGHPGDDQFAELAALLPGYTVIDAIGADLPPLDDPHDPHDPHAPRRQFGNALATRMPVRQVIRHTLPWPADPAAPSMQRVALEAVLDAPGGALRVLVTHLEFYSLAQRLAQVDELRRLQQEAAAHAARPAPPENAEGPFAPTARPVSAIVCGDFNSAYGEDAYRRMLAPLADSPSFIDAWTTLHAGATPPPTAGVYDTVQWSAGPLTCDFVFVTDDLHGRLTSCEIDGAARASDHQPIVLELK
ncbi:endonuclease/exonuclease/phosphatase family metal-dependent hydrolase [Paraburkholderia caballeronis]|uniref:endonuclease/exonuclease/phosphatase family protein n=1 Tax=Paraburkholderia caballeronis TaxID=416943 RepID=UPI0010657313|nr:endonuclease/exonuclease/phosphatase family protein [Paraburkholderia caballeronis]TDV36367.1 endonuclease/exonuclease/phosphatase family metal-dependent hydrolase [Paraburkholderia caballeronis]